MSTTAFSLHSEWITCRYCGERKIAMVAKDKGKPYCGRAHYWAHLRETALERATERFWAGVDKTPTCWLWKPSTTTMRYGRMVIGGQRSAPHRFAFEITYGRILPGLIVCHKCDNRICVRPDHLFVGTYKDNMIDAMRKGRVAKGMYNGVHVHPERRPRGERHGCAKLTDADAAEILRLYEARACTQVAMAKKFGVSASTINMLVKGHNWRWLTV